MILKQSKGMLPREWLYVISDCEDNYILYAPVHKKAVKIKPHIAKNITPILDGDPPSSDIQTEILSFLADYGLLIFPQRDKADTRKNNKIFLSITNKCNLRCIYCYASAGVDNSSMSFDTAKRALDHQLKAILDSKDDTIAVTFHGGGEALVELHLLKRIVMYINGLAERHGLKTALNCVTNATLITKEVAEWLAVNFHSLTVSLDGSQEIQDKQRPNSANLGSFHKAMDGVHNLLDENANFAIRATVTGLSVGKMSEFVQFLGENIFHDGGDVQFEPVSLAGRAKGDNGLATDPETFLIHYIGAREIGRQIGINVECSMDTFGFTKERFCGASKASLQCYTPDGILSACTRVTKKTDVGADLFFYGDIAKDQVNIYLDAKDKIISFENSYIDECHKCFARWNCQGGCMMLRYDGEDHLRHACHVTRELLLHDLRSALDTFSVDSAANEEAIYE